MAGTVTSVISVTGTPTQHSHKDEPPKSDGRLLLIGWLQLQRGSLGWAAMEAAGTSINAICGSDISGFRGADFFVGQ